MKELIRSPVTGLKNTNQFGAIPVRLVLESYKKDLEIDVSRFFLEINEIKIFKCLDTGYLFYYPFNIAGDEAFYDDLKHQLPLKYNSPYYSLWKWEYDVSLKFIDKKDYVCEIGCGDGNFLSKLKTLGILNFLGLELNLNAVKLGISNGLNIEYITVEEKARNVIEEFDVVCAFQVLEHIADIKSFLDSIIKILKPNGRLIIAVPFNDPYLFKNDKYNTLNMPPHHMGLWGKEAFENLEKYFPLKVEDIFIEKLPNSGYDFEQFLRVNKNKLFPIYLPFKKQFDKLYFRWLKKNHYKKTGKNMVVILKKLI